MPRAPDDITQLYREFGGRPQSYRELNRTREAERARERWPLISRLEDMPSAAAVPPVQAGEDSHEAPRRWGVVAAPAAAATPQQQPLPSTPAATHAPDAARAAMPLPWLRQPEASLPARVPVQAYPGSQIEPTLEQAAAPATAPLFAGLRQQPAARPIVDAPGLQTRGMSGGAAGMPASPRTEPPANVRPAAAGGPAWLAPVPAAAGNELQKAFASLGRQASAPVPAAAVVAAAAPAPAPAPAPAAPAWNRPVAASPTAQPAVAAGTESPLSRLARPAAAPAARQGGLHSLFARFLGRENS
ncbi:Meckel syndrome type 1 protein [Oryzisolibacter propanilivorax]|uniref:Meckel syndrome type 1 protein n=1 Tax=Oryzisolibacter propanilivorax TaxID=1527607 RepID=A0A1G9QBE5_9BURK|nr:cellulose biosynthesis protein BcsP [Oryzisolibacter propanilivorax]SDM07675.1 Meckel syndrome type 1 protein [Oryzisolibacter propanilivorax]